MDIVDYVICSNFLLPLSLMSFPMGHLPDAIPLESVFFSP